MWVEGRNGGNAFSGASGEEPLMGQGSANGTLPDTMTEQVGLPTHCPDAVDGTGEEQVTVRNGLTEKTFVGGKTRRWASWRCREGGLQGCG